MHGDSGHLSFTYIYEKYRRRCYLFIKSYVHSATAAEDLASESLIKLWEMSKRQVLDNPAAVLYVIARRKALDYLKHQAVIQSAHIDISFRSKRELEQRINTLEAGDPDKIFVSDIVKIIEETLSSLPQKTREIFEMYRLRDISKAEIASVFGVSVKGVDYHISIALGRLKANLKDYFPILFFIYFQ